MKIPANLSIVDTKLIASTTVAGFNSELEKEKRTGYLQVVEWVQGKPSPSTYTYTAILYTCKEKVL